MVETIDSNACGLAIAEESTPKVLPVDPNWYAMEPNSFPDFGGDVKTVARNPINPTRQLKKGVVVDFDASGGFNTDITAENIIRQLQGFFFADLREKDTTAPMNDTAVVLTGVDGTNEDYEATAGLDIFEAGDLVKAKGFTNSANNGLKLVTAALAASLTVAEDLVDETPTSVAKLERVGFQFPSGDLDVIVAADSITLQSTATDMTGFNLIPGEWIGLGGDTTPSKFANNVPGYGRVKSVDVNDLVLDETTWDGVSETGTGLTIQMFFGNVLKNEATAALIKKRTYSIERTLGQDDDGVQSEYLEGAVSNEFTLNLSQGEILTADLAYIAMDSSQRTGAQGVKTGTRIAALAEDGYNASSNVYRAKMFVIDPTTMNPTSIFAHILSGNITIKNNVTPNKEIGRSGAFETTVGNFQVGGSTELYFATVAGVQAVRNNLDVGLNYIFAQDNSGFVYDIPLLSLGGGKANVEQDQPIKLPLENSAAENANGYTLLANFFPYLPDSLMPA